MASSSQHAQVMGSTRPIHRMTPGVSQIPAPRRATCPRLMSKRSEIKCPPASARFQTIPARLSSPVKVKGSCPSPPRSHPSTKYRHLSDFPKHGQRKSGDHQSIPTSSSATVRKPKPTAISAYISTHSRAPLTPCLSSPPRVFPSISQSSPGGSQKILQRQKTLSPLQVRSEIRGPTPFRKISASEQRQADRSEILASFLKNNGGYLDDSEDEDEEEEEEERESSFLTTLSYPFEFRRPHSLLSYNRSSSTRSSSNSSANSHFQSSSRIVPAHLSELPLEKALSLISQKYN